MGGPHIGSARWTGVPVRALLERVGIDRGVDQILRTSVDGMNISNARPGTARRPGGLLVVGMDGRPLPQARLPRPAPHPGLYGFVGATKVARTAHRHDVCCEAGLLDRTRLGDRRPGADPVTHRHPQGWVACARPGRHRRAAWSQAHQGIRRVEVRVDDGPVGGGDAGTGGPGPPPGDSGPCRGRPPLGRHQLTVRATDGGEAPSRRPNASTLPPRAP